MSYKFCINGRSMTRPITGVDRFAREIVQGLDKLVSPGFMCMVVPGSSSVVEPLELKNIPVIPLGSRGGHLWEQLDFARYVRKQKATAVNLCNTAPFFNTGIVNIHDMNIRANPSYYSKQFVWLYRLMFSFLTRNARVVLTVSEFSRKEIERYYPLARNRVQIVPNAWQHINRVDQDVRILERLGLEPGGFYFAMSSLAPNKNLKWLVETANMNPSDVFVIAGGANPKVFGENEIPQAENVVYCGYVQDSEAKALLSNCKAFLYPTFYEGFGIPPMEALACDAPIVVSDTEVMHEIYGDSACYIDPTVPCALGQSAFSAERAQEVLRAYDWQKSAQRLLDICQDLVKQ